jgi:hypothetical protein
MNERIQELAEQAGILIDWGEDIKVGRWGIGGKYENMQKFAELIVREMCQVINADCELQYSEGVTTNLGGLNQARELIKKHFGVEE